MEFDNCIHCEEEGHTIALKLEDTVVDEQVNGEMISVDAEVLFCPRCNRIVEHNESLDDDGHSDS